MEELRQENHNHNRQTPATASSWFKAVKLAWPIVLLSFTVGGFYVKTKADQEVNVKNITDTQVKVSTLEAIVAKQETLIGILASSSDEYKKQNQLFSDASRDRDTAISAEIQSLKINIVRITDKMDSQSEKITLILDQIKKTP